ncbi:ATP-dependent Clp protease, protease subunit [Salinimicrobium catena]|jgi:ATP-dependent Clp protease protease subunit|uniref:ATP-dependent Clp protease proteolytic subunit n=1 Tax=Salinimicrobium catena TaxID=390640 RepID=A0A1H5H1F4_9FLAO|nr:ATP-dependent Clp endopeptidase proteolytic subunit ClpP [Salinimicrobium catena]SDK67157.1 ATP-dependent Clp protease, protease subunit [Salinimicrobium catena]SEE21823.1 ATP-dependent Clp protease, protease subunit [Salinimicrobium catena]HER40313.1 ATP-dependent Clp endopeptidase proteolytic subunit ClpP [Salinimicrobium catena]
MDYGKEFEKYATKHHGINSNYYNQIISSMNPLGMTPNIIEERQMNIAIFDVFSRLMMDRIIFLGTAINDQVANIIQAQLLFLESTDASKDIQIYINSPGGSVYAGLGIYDTMQFIKPDVATICTGMAASMGAVLLCAGEKGKRSGLPHSRVMIHQPLGGAQGQASDIEITAREILTLKKELYEIIAKHSGQPYEKIEEDSDRDYWMKADKALEYGMIDEILTRS